MRRVVIALGIAVLIAAVTAGVYWHTRGQAAFVAVQHTAVEALAKSLGISLSFSRIDAFSIGSVTIYDVAIEDKKGRTVAAAPQVTVAYSLLNFLRGRSAVETISAITVQSPEVELSQEESGRWNIEEFLQQNQSKPSQFSGKVHIVDGRAAIQSHWGQWLLTDCSATFDFAKQSSIAVHLTGKEKNTVLEADGTVGQSSSTITIKADRLDVQDYAALFASAQVQAASGRILSPEIIIHSENHNITYAGEARLDDVKFSLSPLEVAAAQGMITFTQQGVYLLGDSAQVNGQPVRVRGHITLDGLEPVLDLTVVSDGLDAQALYAGLPIQGQMAVTAAVYGTPAEIKIDGDCKLPQGQLAGYAVADATAKVHYDRQQVIVNDFSANMFGGHITGSGSLDIPAGQYHVRLEGVQLEAADLPAVGEQLSGRGNISLVFDGQPENGALQGVVTMGAGQVAGIPFTAATTGFSRQGSRITLDYLQLQLGQGTVTAGGTVDNNQLLIKVSGYVVPLTALANSVPGVSLAGTADFNGTLQGTLQHPELTAQFTAADGMVMKQPFKKAAGEIRVDADTLTLNQVVLKDGVTSHTVQGSVALNGSTEINLRINTRQARAENLSKLLFPGENITGNVDNDVILSGPLADLDVTGNLTLTQGSFRGYLVASGKGQYHRHHGVTEVKDFTIHSLNAQIALSGTIQPDQQMNFQITASDVDLATLHVEYPYPVSGRVSFTGLLTGTADNPVLNGQLSAAGLSLNGQNLQNVAGNMVIQGSDIYISHFGFQQKNATFSFQGGMSGPEKRLYGDLTVENGELSGLLPILQINATDVSGRLNGHVGLGGTLAQPDLELTGQLNNGRLKNYPLESVDMDITLQSNIVTVHHFEAHQGTGILAIQGTADLQGPLQLEVGGRDIDAGLLTAWFDSSIQMRGKLTFGAQISGTAHDPHAAVSLEISGGGVDNATFDSLYGMFVVDKGNIHVNQLMLSKGDYRASAYGVIPLKALNNEGRQRAALADQMDLKVKLEQANLSILPLLTKDVAWAAGVTKGELQISGTLAQPEIYGGLQVQDGVIKLTALADPIQKVGVDISFEGDKINIKTFEGSMGKGTFRLTGSTALNGLSLENYNMSLALNNIAINHKYFQGPLSGNLLLANVAGKPQLSGKLIFTDDTINIPFIPELSSSNMDIGLDLEMSVGKKVRFYNPYMYDIWGEGHVKFAGSTKYPLASGHVDATHGSVNYLTTQFKVDSGRVEFTNFGSFEPMIKLSAQTQLDQTTVTLTINGPVTAMDMRLTSDPAMSQPEIMSLLTLRSRYFDKQKAGDTGLGHDEVMSLLNAGLQMRFVSEMEGIFRNAFGIDEFRLVSDTRTSDGQALAADQEVYNLEIAKYVSDRLMLSYSVGVDHSAHTMGMQYDLTRHISFTASTDELNNHRLGLEMKFNF